MIRHYIKIAFRNLWKYKLQSVISIVGLAVGFACFALSALWIRYEMTYNTSFENANRIYAVKSKSVYGNSYDTNPSLATYLKETFPEIEEATIVKFRYGDLISENNRTPLFNAWIDSSFLRIFDLEILAGTTDFLLPEANQMALTQKTAKELFGEKNPIGEKVSIFTHEYSVGAIVSDCPEHTTLYFQALSAIPLNKENYTQWNTFILLKQGIDKKKFREKIEKHEIISETYSETLELIPITAVRYADTADFKQITVLAIVGGLVVLCSLLNYLTLFVSRFRIRKKELALRVVSGAAKHSFFTLFSVEFFVTLLLSFLFGSIFIKLIYSYFVKISHIPLNLSDIFSEIVVYVIVIILVAFLLFGLLLIVFRHQTLNASIHKSKNIFRSALVVFQLLISIGFIFCTTVIIKQIHFIRTVDIGFDYKNTAAFWVSEVPNEEIEAKIKIIPEITEYMIHTTPLMPIVYSGVFPLSEWEDKDHTNDDKVRMQVMEIRDNFLDFFKIQFVAGEDVNESEKENYILINESAAQALAWKNPVGKTLTGFYNRIFTVKGVVKDIYLKSAIYSAEPILFIYSESNTNLSYFNIRYKEGTWDCVKNSMETMIKSDYPDKYYNIFNAEEEYNRILDFSKEKELIKILGFCSLVCIIVAVFGFFSLVSLTCEERRKEIAIRKINGATVRDILSLFFREYFLLLIIGAVIAFPIGYYIMNNWLQNYGKQTAINGWIFIAILLGLGLVIFLTIVWRIYKTSVENSTEALKMN